MNYIIFDLEWNQPTRDIAMVTTPVPLTGEIIEIGAVKLDTEFQVTEELRIYVAPQYYTIMNPSVACLTKIHGNYLKKHGIPFPEAYNKFIQWCGQDYAFMTWSQSDLPVLIDNMLLHGLDISHLPVCFDVQRIFDWEIMRSDKQYALDDAIKFLGEKGDSAHDALHDARNTAKVCAHLDLDVYIDEYASQVFAELPQTRVYESLTEILEDKNLLTFPCPWCGEPVKCDEWIQLRSNRFMSMGTCPEGDEFIVYLTRTKVESGHYRVNRLFYEMSDDLWDFYQEQRNLLSAPV